MKAGQGARPGVAPQLNYIGLMLGGERIDARLGLRMLGLASRMKVLLALGWKCIDLSTLGWTSCRIDLSTTNRKSSRHKVYHIIHNVSR